jgi:hypothetical protein
LIDLADLVRWWAAPVRVAALGFFLWIGIAWGALQEAAFVPSVTAEAQIFIRDWRKQLQDIADRAKVLIILPEPAPLPAAEAIGGGKWKLRASAQRPEDAIAAVIRQVEAVVAAIDANDRSLAPYVEFLRANDIPELMLQRPERIEVIQAAAVVAAKAVPPFKAWGAACAFLGALALGTFAFFLMQEAKAERLLTEGR